MEVMLCSNEETIEIYPVPDLSMSDFRQWRDSQQNIPLEKLSDVVSRLDSKDLETNEPISRAVEVDFYLPEPLKDQVFARITNLQEDGEGTSIQSENATRLASVSSLDPVMELKSSVILSAVASEILQKHIPHSNYKVRITDG